MVNNNSMQWKSPEDVKEFVKDVWLVDIDDDEAQKVFDSKDLEIGTEGLTIQKSYWTQEHIWGDRMRKIKK